MDEEPDVPVDDTARMDQLIAAFRDFAEENRAFYVAHRLAGFTRGEALELTCEWVSRAPDGS